MKKLSRISMVGAAMMVATSLFAETNDAFEESFANDSLNVRSDSSSIKKYHFGKRDVIFDASGIHFLKDRNNFDQSFYDDDDQRYPYQKSYYQNNTNDGNASGSNTNQSSASRKKYRYFSSSLSSVDLGIAKFASEPFSVTTDDSVNYLDLNRGFQLGLCFDAVGLPIISQQRFKVGIGVGVGAKFDIYNFSTKNLVLAKNEGRLIHYADTSKPYNKSKLTNTYLTVPVVLEIQNRGLSVMAGVEGNLLVWSNTKMKTSDGDKERTHSDLGQNLFSYNLLAKVAIDCIGVYARVNMSPLFIKNKGPEIYPLSFGATLAF